jgi:hypothetical protein
MPYCVGTKNGLVVTWLTNTKFHLGWLGKFPSLEEGVLVLPPHAARIDDKEKPVVPTAAPPTAPLSKLRRPKRNPDWGVELFDLFMKITSNSKTFVSSQGNRGSNNYINKPTRKPKMKPGTPPFSLLITVNPAPFSHHPHPGHNEYLRCFTYDRPADVKLKTEFRLTRKRITWLEIVTHNTQSDLLNDLLRKFWRCSELKTLTMLPL